MLKTKDLINEGFIGTPIYAFVRVMDMYLQVKCISMIIQNKGIMILANLTIIAD